MFNFFKKNLQKNNNESKDPPFEIELTAAVLAYEIARIDGEVSDDEDEETDEELEQITNDDFEEENSKSEEGDIEPIKRGWFDWRKRKEKTI